MDKTIEIQGLPTTYSVSGPAEAPAILLMHGWGCSHATLQSIENLLNKGMRVINIDLPGHGATQEPPEIWGIEAYTRFVEEFISRVCPDVSVLLGHSFGGRIAIMLGSRHPEIKKILLVDAAGIKPRRPLKYYIKVYSFKAAKIMWKLLLGAEKAQKRIEEERRRRGSADYAASSPVMRGVLSKVVNEDLRHLMPSITASTLLIWGENDTATPLSDAKTMERLIPDAGLASFPGCGHYSFLDNPRGFAAVATTFLKPELSHSK